MSYRILTEIFCTDSKILSVKSFLKKVMSMKDFTWSLFCRTGYIGNYMLYKKLEKISDDEAIQ